MASGKPTVNGPVQLANDDWSPQPTGKSRAQREQASTSEWDHRMVDIARLERPTIAWWWGVRRDETGHWARCYVCNTNIVKVSDRPGISADQRSSIHDHRATHYQDMINELERRSNGRNH